MVEVTQADRELFIAILNPCESVAESVRKGMSYTWEVEQIARHRLAERERAFSDGFSAALQGAEAVIWAIEDDAFLYPTVSDALQEVIAELQEMEGNWTKRSSVAHRHAVQEEAHLAERDAVVKWLRRMQGNAGKWSPMEQTVAAACRYLADAIEAGEPFK